jgi:hypothetical protein
MRGEGGVGEVRDRIGDPPIGDVLGLLNLIFHRFGLTLGFKADASALQRYAQYTIQGYPMANDESNPTLSSRWFRPVLSAAFLFLGAYQLFLESRRIPKLSNSPGMWLFLLFYLALSSLWILGGIGLWRTRRWGWWLSTALCVSTLSWFICDVTTFLVLRHSFPKVTLAEYFHSRRFIVQSAWFSTSALLLVLLSFQAIKNQFFQHGIRRIKQILSFTGIFLFAPLIIAIPMVIQIYVLDPRSVPTPPGLKVTFAKDIDQVMSMSLSPDGRTIAMEAIQYRKNKDEHSLALLDLKTEKSRAFPLLGSMHHLAWSPDGRMIALDFLTADGVYLHETSTGKLLHHLNLPCQFEFHPDGTLWYLLHKDNSLWRFHPNTGVSEPLIETCNPIHQFALSPDGKRIVFVWGGWDDVSLVVFDAGTLTRIAQWQDGNPSHIRDMRFSSDGRRFFSIHGDFANGGSVKVWNSGTGQLEYIIPNVETLHGDFSHFDISRDGRFLSAVRKDGPISIWSMEHQNWVWDMPKEGTITLWTNTLFSPDGSELWTLKQLSLSTSPWREGALRRWDLKSIR